MRELKKEEMLKIEGGANFSAAMITAITKALEVIYSIGESLGSYLRRKETGKLCDL